MRIFIADLDRDVRLGMQMLVRNQPGMRVVGIAAQPEGLVGQVGAAQPDIVLLDWQLLLSSPVDIIRNIASLSSQPCIIVMHIQPETRQTAEAAGADFFISKDGSPDHLRIILQHIRQNKMEVQ